uniref:Peptidase A2 domain-containing protein n=1 Tax=Peronospora matthiolae TaxID=2874970 RepID=A0AAV1TJE3_9STRA
MVQLPRVVKRVKVDATNNALPLTSAEIGATLASIATRVKIIETDLVYKAARRSMTVTKNTASGVHSTNQARTIPANALPSRSNAKSTSLPETKRTAHKKSNYPRFEEEEASDSDSDSELKLVGLVKKKQPSAKLAPLRIPVQFKDASGTFNALLDSGASRSIINQETMRANAQLGHRQVESATKFQTVNGEVASAGSTIVQFRFPSLQPSTIITHKFEILDQSQDAMVIGRDILNELGIVLNFKDKLVQWDGHDTHLNTGGSSSPNASDYEFPEESKEVDNTAVRPEDLMPDRLSKPLVGKYLQLLRDNEHLYDGHLGRMRFEDYALPIVPEYKPVHAKTLSSPKKPRKQGSRAHPAFGQHRRAGADF